MTFRRHRQDIRYVALIFALAFLVRLPFVLWVDYDPQPAKDDSWLYFHSAKAMADGQGYVYLHIVGAKDPSSCVEIALCRNAHLQVAPTADHPPGYTALLAAVFRLPGPDLLKYKLVNVFMGAAGCSLLYLFGRLASGRAVGIASGLLLAFFPSHVFYSALPISEVTYSTLLTAVLLLFLWMLAGARTASWRPTLLLGLALGVITLVRGEGVLLFLVFGAVWWMASHSLKRGVQVAAVSFLGLAIILSGWTVRNAIQLGAPIPISTGSSVNFAISHWKGADGGGNIVRNFAVAAYYPDVPYPEREVKASQKQLRDGVHYAVTHPARELSLIPRRIFYLFEDDHTAVDWLGHYHQPVGKRTLDQLRQLSDTYYYASALLSLAGVWLWWRARRDVAALLAGVVLYTSAVMGIVYFGAPRYHAALVPVFCLAAAPGLVAVKERAAGALRALRARPASIGET